MIGRRQIQLGIILALAVAIFIVPYAHAQTPTNPTCSGSCLSEDCYTYQNCKPLKETCKTGNCCIGTCTSIPESEDEKVNYIGEQNIEILKKLDSLSEQAEHIRQPSLELHGTEYQMNVGDFATVFLQLRDSQNFPVNNGNCFVSIYYPETYSLSRPSLISSAPMMKHYSNNGLYYYGLFIPDYLGVYMISASCSYAYGLRFLYEPNSLNKPLITPITGTYSGDTVVLNSYTDNQYTSCASAGGATKICEAYYDFNATGIINITDISAYFSGHTSAPSTIIMYSYNWTSSSWITLPNTLSTSGTSTDEFLTNSIPLDGNINENGTIRIRLYSSSGAVYTLYNNWLSLKFTTTEGSVQDVKGSGEIHTSDIANNVWTLFFKRGTPPLAPSTDYYCDINNTDILHKNITYEFIDDKGKIDYFSKVEDETCGFGCIEGNFIIGHATCDSDPTTKAVIAIIIILVFAVALWFIIKNTGGEEE